MIDLWLLSFLVFWLGGCSGTVVDVSVAGIFNLYDEEVTTRHRHAQYLGAFLMAVDEINNKTDGIYDDLLPNTTLHVAVRHGATALEVSRAAVNLVESDRVNGEIGVDAVVSSIGTARNHDILLSEIFSHSKTLHVLSRSHNPDVSSYVEAHFPYNVNLAPDSSYQAFTWQSTLCLIGYTYVSVFYSDDMFGIAAKERLTDGSFCPIKLASAARIQHNQKNFSREIKEAYDSLSIVQILFLDVDTAAPLLEQAYSYGHARIGHTFIFNSEILRKELWERMEMESDVVDILRGAAGVVYQPQDGLINSLIGQSFQQRFRNRPSTLIDGVCDTSVDDSDGLHYLYRNEDGSLCAGLNHSSFVSASDFAPKVGLVYDGVIALALGLHELLHVENKSSIDSLELRQAIQENVAFTGVSGYINPVANPSTVDGLIRESGYHYELLGFNEGIYNSPNRDDAFVYVGDWNGVNKFGNKCLLSNPRCYPHYFNTYNGQFPAAIPRYVSATMPEVVKIGVMINTFNEDGSVNAAGVQQLAAFLMAVREINNKTDGIADDLLPNTKVVVSVRSAHGMLDTQLQVKNLVEDDFSSGVDFIVSGLGITETYAIYSMEDNLRQPVAHSAASHYLLDNAQIAPYKIQMLQSSSLYGTALQSLICDYYEYRKISIFVSNAVNYQNALQSLLNGEFCQFTVLSQYTVSVRQTNFDSEIVHAKAAGVRIFVILADSFVSAHLVYLGTRAGLFGEGRQVFGHADIFEYVAAPHPYSIGVLADDHDIDEMYHGFIGVRERPNYALSLTSTGKNFVSRWRKQAATNGSWVDGKRRCNMARDDNDAFLLYASPPNFQYTYNCSGLHFASFDEYGRDIANHAPHAYDTVMLLAHAYDQQIYAKSHDNPTAMELYHTIINDVAFEGSSGYVDLYEGEASQGYLDRGTRRTGQYFDVINYVGSHYIANATLSDHHLIGVWEIRSGFVPCYDDDNDHNHDDHTHRRLFANHDHGCYAPVYNSHNGKPVSETPSPIIYHQNRVGFQVLGAFIAFIATAFLAFVTVNWEYGVIKNAQCGMLPVMCVGCLFITARLIIISLDLNSAMCVAHLVVFHVAFVMFFLPVILSSTRIFLRSLYPKKLRHVLSQFNVRIMYVFLGTTILVIVLTLAWVDPGVTYGYESTNNNNQETRYPNCITRATSLAQALPLIIESILSLVGLGCAYAVRGVRDANLEAKVNLSILSVFCGMVFLVFPIWLLLDVGPYVRVNIAEYNIAGVVLFCLLLLYINRRDMLKRFIEDEDYFLKSCSEIKPAPLAKSKSVSGAYCVFRTLPRDDQMKMCKVQISKWVDTLMQLQDPVRGISLTQLHDRKVPKIEVTDGKNNPFRRVMPSQARTVSYSNFDMSLMDIPEEEEKG